MMNLSLTSEASRKNYKLLSDILQKVSYKPGWKIVITEEQNEYALKISVYYEGYESKNAICTPIITNNRTDRSQQIAARLLGKSLCEPERRGFFRKFYMLDLEKMKPEDLIRYVIGDTIRQAEMVEFERWFKFEGDTVFG
jgi:hypothetical protein